MYKYFFKPLLGRLLALIFLLFFWWLYLILAILVRIKLGSPVLFTQDRPGMIDPKTGKEKIFKLYKFRTMTDKRDENGELLPDEVRLTSFGRKLRSTSLDELPELINILKGDMAIVGPRPQLVRDMVFMTSEQRKRHTVLPGLTGLAQVKGRNSISWDDKLSWDLKYVEDVTFVKDLQIILATIKAVLTQNGITDGENATALDYGDVLLRNGLVTREEYDSRQIEAQKILGKR